MVPRNPVHVDQQQDYFRIQRDSSPTNSSPCDTEELDNPSPKQIAQDRYLQYEQSRPETPRRSTDPLVTAPLHAQLHNDLTVAHSRPRNRSPYSRTHLRSRSGGSSLAAPPMARALSLPTQRTTTHASLSPSSTPLVSTSSPVRTPARARSPFRSQPDDMQSNSAMSPQLYDSGFEIIAEDSELDLTPRAAIERSSSPLYGSLNSARVLTSRRQRPSSPLNGFGFSSAASSSASSPNLAPAKFNEGFPALHHYPSTSSFSSMPSTPSSARSRSPSISSLETIEDAPDAECEAIEAERLARFKASTENPDSADGEKRRSSLEIPGARSGVGFGFGRGAGQARKRWSICGGERRADLDLETIWED